MENRYDKYKDSGIAWIGEIPEHWEVKKEKSFQKEERPVRDNDEIVTCLEMGKLLYALTVGLMVLQMQ